MDKRYVVGLEFCLDLLKKNNLTRIDVIHRIMSEIDKERGLVSKNEL